RNGYTSPILGYLLGYSGTNSTACQRLSSQTRYVIDISCPASVSSLEVRAAVEGNAPGRFSMNASVTTSAVDLDTSNNSATWETNVRCSINGTPGDDILHGTKKPDSICGGKGDDKIKVGAFDRAFGGNGRDVFYGVDHSGFESDGDSWAIGGP